MALVQEGQPVVCEKEEEDLDFARWLAQLLYVLGVTILPRILAFVVFEMCGGMRIEDPPRLHRARPADGA